MKSKLSLITLTFVGAFFADSTNVGCSNRMFAKIGFSKIDNNNFHKNWLLKETVYSRGDSDTLKKDYENHRSFGVGYAYKYYLPHDVFVGFNIGYDNSNNRFHASIEGREAGKPRVWDFKLKHSVNFMPYVGVTLHNVDIYGMIGLEYTQIDYSQMVVGEKYDSIANRQNYNDYKVHNWRGNYVWGAGVDLRFNETMSIGIDYKKTRIKFSFTEYPNDARKNSSFKTDHHVVSIAFKYKF